MKMDGRGWVRVNIEGGMDGGSSRRVSRRIEQVLRRLSLNLYAGMAMNIP